MYERVENKVFIVNPCKIAIRANTPLHFVSTKAPVVNEISMT